MLDERALLPRLRTLDQEALATIYDALQPPLYRYAFRLLGRSDVAEELVAETFHRLLQALAKGQGPERHVQAWLYRVLHNLVVDHYRRPAVIELSTAEELPAESGPEEEVQRRIARERVRRALRKLTLEQQQVIMGKFMEGLSNEEIAALLGKPVGAVKSLQHRALAALRRLLGTAPLPPPEEKR